jgi:peptidyl-prolyl cis-trans isomerase D
MAFSLKPKEVGVVKSDFGWHVIQTLEKEPAKLKTFDEVKDQLATELRREAVQNRMQQLIEDARTELAKNPNGAAEIANRLGLIYSHGEKVSGTDSLPELGSMPELESAVAGVKAGQVSQVFQVGQNRLGVAAVLQVFPAHPAELAEVEDQVRERVISDKVARLTDESVKAATAKMKAANGDLSALAKQLGTTVKEADYFTMDAAAEGIGPASYLAEGFSKPEGTVIGPFDVNGEVVLAKVTGKQVADMGELAKQRDDLVLELKRRRASQRKELFEDGLLAQLLKEGKVKKYPEVINRILAGYRS